MLLLSSEYSFPPGPLGALLSLSRSGLGLSPSPVLSLVQSPPTPHLFERRLIGRAYAQGGKSVQPVRGKAGAGVASEVSVPQQFIDQAIAFAPARVHAYTYSRSTHHHVWSWVH